jgi:hypothetical protein
MRDISLQRVYCRRQVNLHHQADITTPRKINLAESDRESRFAAGRRSKLKYARGLILAFALMIYRSRPLSFATFGIVLAASLKPLNVSAETQ